MTDKPLALLKSMGYGENILIYSSPFDIGRNKTAKLIIPHVNVSRNHCQLICNTNQTWVLKDFSSSGTYINGELVRKGNSKTIKDNDVIRVGHENGNFIWKFITNVDKVRAAKWHISGFMGNQCQAIVDICNEKATLQRQIILNRESCLKMKLEKEKLHKKCLTQFISCDHRSSGANEKLKIKFDESKVCKDVVKEEEEKNHMRIKKELQDLQKKITENDKKEEKLKLEVQKLQEKLAAEQIQWEKKFLEEKKKLEEKINEQNKNLAAEKGKIEEISIAHEQELEDLLKKEEEEKRILMGKLQEMEEAKKILSQKLKESDEFHLLEKAKIEEQMKKELLKREENIKTLLQEHTASLQSNRIPVNKSQREKDQEDIKSQDLLKELDQVKSALMESESRQKLLEKELAEIDALKDQANRVKSNVLENMADLMESELQCSICSELFVTATTLNCTHTFCKYCIETWKKKKKSCPICRKKITCENRSIVMDNYIDRMVENLSDEFKNRRRTVIEERHGKPFKMPKTSLPSESSGSRQPSTSTYRRRAQSTRTRNDLT